MPLKQNLLRRSSGRLRKVLMPRKAKHKETAENGAAETQNVQTFKIGMACTLDTLVVSTLENRQITLEQLLRTTVDNLNGTIEDIVKRENCRTTASSNSWEATIKLENICKAHTLYEILQGSVQMSMSIVTKDGLSYCIGNTSATPWNSKNKMDVYYFGNGVSDHSLNVCEFVRCEQVRDMAE